MSTVYLTKEKIKEMEEEYLREVKIIPLIESVQLWAQQKLQQ